MRAMVAVALEMLVADEQRRRFDLVRRDHGRADAAAPRTRSSARSRFAPLDAGMHAGQAHARDRAETAAQIDEIEIASRRLADAIIESALLW